MSAEKFRTEFAKCKTYGEMDAVIKEHLSKEEAEHLVKCMETVHSYCELTMRDVSLMSTLKSQLKHGILK